jgi:hypothetical protein
MSKDDSSDLFEGIRHEGNPDGLLKSPRLVSRHRLSLHMRQIYTGQQRIAIHSLYICSAGQIPADSSIINQTPVPSNARMPTSSFASGNAWFLALPLL